MDHVVGFALVAAAVTLTPGADTLLVLSTAIRFGKAHGVSVALGVVSGVLCWGIAAAAGLSALLLANEDVYQALRLAGAAYLMWLGARSLTSALRSEAMQIPPVSQVTSRPGCPTRRRSYVRGLTTNLLNPKIGVFYVSLLPQFLPQGQGSWAVGTLLAGIHAAEGVLYLSVVATAAARCAPLFARPTVSRVMGVATGGVFLALGARLALKP